MVEFDHRAQHDHARQDTIAIAAPGLYPSLEGPHITAQDMPGNDKVADSYAAPDSSVTIEHIPLPLSLEQFEGQEPTDVTTAANLFVTANHTLLYTHPEYIDSYQRETNVGNDTAVVFDQRKVDLEYQTSEGWALITAYPDAQIVRLEFKDRAGNGEGLTYEYHMSEGVLCRRTMSPGPARLPTAPAFNPGSPTQGVRAVGIAEGKYITALIERSEPFAPSFRALEHTAQLRLAHQAITRLDPPSSAWKSFDSFARRRLAKSEPQVVETAEEDGAQQLRVEVGSQNDSESGQPFVSIQYSTPLTDATVREWLAPSSDAQFSGTSLDNSRLTVAHYYTVQYDQAGNGLLVCHRRATVQDPRGRLVVHDEDSYTGDQLEVRLVRGFVRKPRINKYQ